MKEESTPSRLQSFEEENDVNLYATVRIYGNLGKRSDGKRVISEKVRVPIRVEELLALLSSSYGLEIRRDSTLVLVNGVEANALEDLDTLIVSGDEVSLVPMFHGGVHLQN
jgi:molybdopterin converting factor small subunit